MDNDMLFGYIFNFVLLDKIMLLDWKRLLFQTCCFLSAKTKEMY